MAQFSAGDDATKWILIGAAALLVVYTVMRPMSRRRKADPLERPFASSLASQRSVEREMSNLLVELTEMTRQVGAQLDTRAARLEVLIQQADERIARLEAGGAAPDLPRRANLQARTPDPLEAGDAGPAAGAPDDRHGEVYALADAGNSAHEIAARLGRPAGEIQLILALRSKTA